MEEQRYSFEDIPEGERFWFVTQWGMPPKMEAEQNDLELPSELATEFEDTVAEVRAETVFGIDREEARKKMREVRAIQKRMEAVGYAPDALSVPWWTEAENKWVHEKGNEYIEAPQLFTTREAAETERQDLEQSSPEAYLSLVERYGQGATDKAFDNVAPLRAVWTDRESLLSSLEDSDFLCVMVDGVLKLRRDFIEELRKQAEQE